MTPSERPPGLAVVRLRAGLATTGSLAPCARSRRRTAARRASRGGGSRGSSAEAVQLPLPVLTLLADASALDELAALAAALLHANDMAMCISGTDRGVLDAAVAPHVAAIAMNNRTIAPPPQGLGAKAIAARFDGDAAALRALWLKTRTNGLAQTPELPALDDSTRLRFDAALSGADALLEAARDLFSKEAT